MTSSLAMTVPPSIDGLASRTDGKLVVESWPASRWRDAAALWQDLDERRTAAPLTSTFPWVDCWLKNYGDLLAHQFLIARSDYVPVGICLLTEGQEPDSWFGVRRLHVGTAGEQDRDSVCVEYNGWNVLDEYRPAFAAALTDHLRDDPRWDELCFDGFSRADFGDEVSGNEWITAVAKPARWTDLAEVRDSGEELITFFGDSTRKSIRQNVRDLGQVTTEWAADTAEAHAFFDELIVFHQARWNADGFPGCYSSRRFTQFHRDLINRLVPAGQMVIARVSTATQTLGCSQLLIDRGRVLVYQGGRRVGESKGSPGLITDYSCMQESLNRGYLAFDFMAGDSIHKKRLTNRTTDLVWTRVRRPRWKFTILDRLRHLKQRLRAPADSAVK